MAEKSSISSCDINTGVLANQDATEAKATADAGGVIGEAVSSVVNGCRYFGAITSPANSGGIIGKADDASSAGVTTACGFGGTINGTTVTKDNLSTCAIGSTTGKRGTFYLWDGVLQ